MKNGLRIVYRFLLKKTAKSVVLTTLLRHLAAGNIKGLFLFLVPGRTLVLMYGQPMDWMGSYRELNRKGYNVLFVSEDYFK